MGRRAKEGGARRLFTASANNVTAVGSASSQRLFGFYTKLSLWREGGGREEAKWGVVAGDDSFVPVLAESTPDKGGVLFLLL